MVNSGGAQLTATDCTFRGNSVEGGTKYAFGGAIANVTDSRATVTRCTFADNSATSTAASYGGAIGNFGASILSVSGGAFTNNVARGAAGSGAAASGGAIATRPGTVNTSGSRTTISGTLFLGNRAVGAEAGDAHKSDAHESDAHESDAHESDAHDSDAHDSDARGSDARGGNANGGALANIDSSLTLSRSRFLGNKAVAGSGGMACGGAIDAASLFGGVAPTTTIDGCLFDSNQAIARAAGVAFGGACSNSEGLMVIDRTTFVSNSALIALAAKTVSSEHVGEALHGSTDDNTPHSLHDSEPEGDRGSAFGGALANGATSSLPDGTAATLVLRFSTVSRNHAVAGPWGVASGGGLFNGNLAAGLPPVVRIVASRFVGNTPPGFGAVAPIGS